MNPWKLLDRAPMPGSVEELRLYQRDAEFSLKAGNYELMNSRLHGSEDALANLACQNIPKHAGARVLIGGLGMGYTVRSALDGLGAKAQVDVAELVPAVVRWNWEYLADLAGSPLEDNRVTLHEADVVQMIQIAKGTYHAILLDVDNGPQELTRRDNGWLYSLEGLKTTYAALRPEGVLAIWASGPAPDFAQRLRQAGFEPDQVRMRARGPGMRKGGGHHMIWIAIRAR